MDTERKAFELTEPFTAEELIGLAESVHGRRRAAILAYANSLQREAAMAELIAAIKEYKAAQFNDPETSGMSSAHRRALASDRLNAALSRLGASA